MPNPADVLQKTTFFQGVSPDALAALAGICVPKHVSRRELLFGEGARGHALYVLVTGGVRLFRSTGDGKDVVIKMVQPGELFGEVVLFEAERYPVSAETVQDSFLYVLPRLQFLCLLDRPDFRNDFIAMLMRKQRYLVSRIQLLSVASLEERLFVFLHEHFGEREDVRLTLSKKDVAAAVGITPETLSRVLQRLRDDGVLAWEGHDVRLRPGFWAEWRRER